MSGAAPPTYDKTRKIGAFDETIKLSPASFLDLSLSAKNVRSSADWSEVFPNRVFATGDASFGSLVPG